MAFYLDKDEFNENDIEWVIKTFHLHSREDALRLMKHKRGKTQNKALLSRIHNTTFINEHPRSNVAREVQQVSEVRFDGEMKPEEKISDLGFSWKNYDVFFNSAVSPEQRQKVKDNLRKLERKGEVALKVGECKLQARRKKKSITLPKVMTIVLWSMNENGHCEGTFFTGTFSPRFMSATSKQTRRKMMYKWASSQGCEFFIMNIDYGKKNGREHYHILFSGHVDVSSYKNTFHSLCYVEEIFGDSEHLAYYETKMTNHAYKETTRDKSCSSMRVSPSLVGLTSQRQVVFPLPLAKSEDLDNATVSLDDGHSHYSNGTINDSYCHNYDKDTLDLIRGKVRRPVSNRLRDDEEEGNLNELHDLQTKYCETD